MRIVVKIGTSLLTDSNGALAVDKLEKHVANISKLHALGHQIVFVTSGSIAAGFNQLGFKERPKDLVEKQACAGVGQCSLIACYSSFFKNHGINIGQMLITRTDLFSRASVKNAKSALEIMLERKIIPIVNENDLIAVTEINFGDNDTLGALVGGMLSADYLMILTDEKGLYSDNPKENPDAVLIPHVSEVNKELLEKASSNGSKFGRGGMQSKLIAAKTGMSLGLNVFIGSGKSENEVQLVDVLSNRAVGTYFNSESTKKYGLKQQWITFHAPINGKVFVDEGAKFALQNRNSSLLSVGVVSVLGNFVEGDVIEVFCNDEILGRGISEIASGDLQKKLKVPGNEVINRDYWISSLVD